MLERLPPPILIALPSYLHSLQDLHSLILTSQTIYNNCSNLTSIQLFNLITSPDETTFQPYPHLLMGVKAKQLSEWSLKSKKNLEKFRKVIKKGLGGGEEGLFFLALEVGGPITFDDLRFLRRIKLDIIDPLKEILDPECGPSSQLASEFLTVCNDVGLALINYWIYCELFFPTFDLPRRFGTSTSTTSTTTTPTTSNTSKSNENENDTSLSVHPTIIRLEWLGYCVPDVNAPLPSDLDSESRTTTTIFSKRNKKEFLQLDIVELSRCISIKIQTFLTRRIREDLSSMSSSSSSQESETSFESFMKKKCSGMMDMGQLEDHSETNNSSTIIDQPNNETDEKEDSNSNCWPEHSMCSIRATIDYAGEYQGLDSLSLLLPNVEKNPLPFRIRNMLEWCSKNYLPVKAGEKRNHVDLMEDEETAFFSINRDINDCWELFRGT